MGCIVADSYGVLLKAIIAKLKATAALTAIVSTRIYSNIPQNTTFPFAAVSISSIPFDGDAFTGMEHNIQVQGFSRKPTPDEAADIRSAVYDALNRNESGLTLDSGSVRHIHYTGTGFVEREPDGVTWQSLVSFRCIVT